MTTFLWVSVAVHLALAGGLAAGSELAPVLLSAYGVYHGIVAWGFVYPRSRLFGPNRSRLTTRERVVALTFDDGPHPSITPRVLEILHAYRAPATFFVIGKWTQRYPEIVRDVVARGHGLGNHTFGHSYLFWALRPGPLMREVRRAQDAIEAATGLTCRWFRAPVGIKSFLLHPILRRLGLNLVSWDVRHLDRKLVDRGRLTKRLRRRIVPGSILLLHDGHDRRPEGNPAVLEVLPCLLETLERLGYRCVPLAEG